MHLLFKHHILHVSLLLIFFVGFSLPIAAQVQEGEQEKEMDIKTEDWVPTLLHKRPNTYIQLLRYGGYGIGWKYRGLNDEMVQVLNSIVWDPKMYGIPLYGAMAGLSNLTNTELIQFGFGPSEEGVSSNALMHYAIINAVKRPKQISFVTKYRPVNGRQYNHFIWNTGLRNSSWASMLKIHQEKTFLQDPALGKSNSIGVAFNAVKIRSTKSSLGISFWFNHLQQTKQSPSVAEAHQLSAASLYHPGWGWLDGELIFPNNRGSNLPMGQIGYTHKINDRHSIQLEWAIAFGKQTEDGLDWTSTKDPRPDYYKYLPSYYSDTALRLRLTKAIKDNPYLLQFDFDQMKKINQSNAAGRSFYSISQEQNRVLILQQAFKYRFDWSEVISFSFFSHTNFSRIHTTNTIVNLLGGKYYLNHNSWVNDEGVDVFQFNIQEPDQKIREGESWGPNFLVKNMDQQFGWAASWQFARWEHDLGLGYGFRFFQREGFNQNGLYPNHSLGKSPWYFFPSNKMQWQSVYKQNARRYYSLKAFVHSLSPNWKDAFMNVSMQDQLANFLLPLQDAGLDIGIHFLGIPFKSDWHLYCYQKKNNMGHSSFYHDYYNSFVLASYGLMHIRGYGLEGGFETNLNTVINYQIAFSWGKQIIINNPIYTIQLLNNEYPLERGNLNLKNLPASTNPQILVATGLQAQFSSSFRVGFNAQIGWDRYLSLDYYRRSFLWEKKFKNQFPQSSFLPISPLANGWMGNLFINKSFQYRWAGYQHRINFFVQLNNVFNTRIPVLAFEPSRFDYKNFVFSKFAPKYLFGYPLNVSLQMIYQLN